MPKTKSKLAAKLSKKEKQLQKLQKKSIDFLGDFIHIFEQDWEYTKHCMGEQFIENGQTFTNPHATQNNYNEGNNWHSRPSFLSSFRKFRKFVKNSKLFKKARIFTNETWGMI